jgi:hypothetical protein
MMDKNIYLKIKRALDKGVIACIRLVRIDQNNIEPLFPYNKPSEPEKAYKRLEYFKEKIDRDLPPGEYEIQGKSSYVNSMVEKYPVTITAKKLLVSEVPKSDEKEPVENLSDHQQIYEPEFMDADEYKKLIREMETLRGQVRMLEIERDWFRDLSLQKQGQPEKEKGLGDGLAEMAKEAIPAFVNLADRFLSLREKDNQFKQEMSDSGRVPVKKETKSIQINPDHAIDYYNNLLDTNEEKAYQELNDLRETNPQLYDVVYDALFEEGEEEQEEETGT